ncbi:MAG: nucleotide exchange factor GrpE [Betaproteobacteria bacterium RIFCSPLOWO2_12_FULL_62_13]|nr:MAG: nucleotide exchange factor GrpE [Betaproteobacteria bacterium RIFCSPLOWO2_12_FULL_62_13]
MQDIPELAAPDDSKPEQQQKPSAIGDAAPAAEPAQPVVEVVPSVEELLRTAELAAQEHHDAWLRAKAEADNIRKRAQAEIASAHKFAVENFASELLAVKDSLEAALATDNTAVERLKSGVELTLKQLTSVFEKFNLTEINPAGEKFDPHRHQAISTVESDAEPNTVVQVLQKGYLLHERLIRPALVTVARARGS